MAATSNKSPIDFKDPFVIWGGILIGLGIAFGGATGGAIGALAGIYVTQLSKKKEYSNSKKYVLASGASIAAVVVYILVLALVFSTL